MCRYKDTRIMMMMRGIMTMMTLQHIVVATSNPKPLQHEKGWQTNSVGRLFRFPVIIMEIMTMIMMMIMVMIIEIQTMIMTMIMVMIIVIMMTICSHKFGYGLLDAGALVRAAATWKTSPAQRICETRSSSGSSWL